MGHPEIEVIPVYFAEYPKRYFTIDTDRLIALDKEYAKSLRQLDPTPWRKLLRRFDRLRALEPKQGDIVFVAGAGWVSIRRTIYLAELQRRRHPTFVQWIHDLIPITHPEFVSHDHVHLFRSWIDTVLSMSGVFLCNSRFTREELLTYAAAAGRQVDAVAVPLAHEFSAVNPVMRGSFHYLKSERFVLSVGTVDLRKNQLSLVPLWERLYREMGKATPILVLAGWASDLFEACLQAACSMCSMYGQVVHIRDASDAELAWLYEHCEFTVYPSLHEGWGLPVGESLWFGKPCICYRHSSLPEVGGDHAIFCDLHDRNSLERAVRAGIAGKFPVRPPARSQLRTWDAVTAEMIQAIRASAS